MALVCGIKGTVMLDYYVPRAKGRGKRGGGASAGERVEDDFLVTLNKLCSQARPSLFPSLGH